MEWAHFNRRCAMLDLSPRKQPALESPHEKTETTPSSAPVMACSPRQRPPPGGEYQHAGGYFDRHRGLCCKNMPPLLSIARLACLPTNLVRRWELICLWSLSVPFLMSIEEHHLGKLQDQCQHQLTKCVQGAHSSSGTMAKNYSTSVQLLMILLVLLVFVSSILGAEEPSKCVNRPEVQQNCPPIHG
ncbi:hypothetical protein ACP70R_031194 [Stipagrostis hirtigluma subsp. patula]